ncbi:MAG TPA: carboxypeptidase-like regulatory domain-containing protein [Vicinamibacteria bacterium]|nr:carboxypeptidase-like regulatory domain-containing protein [Vicinamibacteria bacterium]
MYCTALRYPDYVTNLAAWSTSGDEFGLAPPLDPPVAVFTSPGVVTPLRQGNIYVRAKFAGEYGSSPHSYAVDPSAPPVVLAPLSGQVYEDNGKYTAIPDVTVEIIDGAYNTGKRAMTLSNGFYNIDHLRMAVPFTARASRPGYQTQVLTHPGLTDDINGYPDNNSLHFYLKRL